MTHVHRRRNPVKTIFKVENLTENSVIVVRKGSALDTPYQMRHMGEELLKRNLGSVVVMKLENLNDFVSISEPQMNRLGWFRKEKEENVLQEPQ